MKAIFHPKAHTDLHSYIEYLQGQDAPMEVLLEVLEAINLACKKIERNPGTWSVVPGSRSIRKVQISRFGMQVVYQLRPDGTPFILEVIGRGAQPRWRERL